MRKHHLPSLSAKRMQRLLACWLMVVLIPASLQLVFHSPAAQATPATSHNGLQQLNKLSQRLISNLKAGHHRGAEFAHRYRVLPRFAREWDRNVNHATTCGTRRVLPDRGMLVSRTWHFIDACSAVASIKNNYSGINNNSKRREHAGIHGDSDRGKFRIFRG